MRTSTTGNSPGKKIPPEFQAHSAARQRAAHIVGSVPAKVMTQVQKVEQLTHILDLLVVGRGVSACGVFFRGSYHQNTTGNFIAAAVCDHHLRQPAPQIGNISRQRLHHGPGTSIFFYSLDWHCCRCLLPSIAGLVLRTCPWLVGYKQVKHCFRASSPAAPNRLMCSLSGASSH